MSVFFHLRRERDPAIAEAKRQAIRAEFGRLVCEACGFTSETAYTNLTGDVCEVHHRRPLGDLDQSVETRLEDLAILCANCHRAIHKTRPLLSVEEFRTTVVRSDRDSD